MSDLGAILIFQSKNGGCFVGGTKLILRDDLHSYADLHFILLLLLFFFLALDGLMFEGKNTHR